MAADGLVGQQDVLATADLMTVVDAIGNNLDLCHALRLGGDRRRMARVGGSRTAAR
jgi:hypothetical protein